MEGSLIVQLIETLVVGMTALELPQAAVFCSTIVALAVILTKNGKNDNKE